MATVKHQAREQAQQSGRSVEAERSRLRRQQRLSQRSFQKTFQSEAWTRAYDNLLRTYQIFENGNESIGEQLDAFFMAFEEFMMLFETLRG